jgi:hypothetical protein
MDIPGLLGRLAGLPGAINQGLLGSMPVDPRLGLDPQMLQQARQGASTDFAMGLVAGGNNPQTLLASKRGATEGFRGRVFDMIKEQEFVRLNQDRKKREDEDAMLRSQIAAYKQENPQDANLPDAIILKKMDPSFGIDTARLALDQTQTAATLANQDRNYALQQQQAAQQEAQANRMYELQRLEAARKEAEFRASLKTQSSFKPTEGTAKAGQFVSRMKQVSGDIRNEAPSMAQYGLYNTTLNSAGMTQGLANKAMDDGWLKHFNASRAFLAGVLRQDTGAAITPDETRQYYPTYFPIPGDSAAVIEQKRALRENEMARMAQTAVGQPNVGTTPTAEVSGFPSLSTLQAEFAKRGMPW